MAKILIAWELGANLGHIARCTQIADALAAHGHQVVFALRNTAAARRYLSGKAFAQAPLPIAAKRHPAPASYAEILLGEGYADPDILYGLLSAWGNLLRMVSADDVIADHAPTAMFAAHCFGVPYLAVGNGFAIPPALDPLPSIRPWENIPVVCLQHASELLSKVMAEAGNELGFRRPISLTELFEGKSLIDSFPELDHYGVRPQGPYIGPIYKLSKARQVTWLGSHTRRVLAYLQPDTSGLAEMLGCLSKLNAEVLMVAPGLPVQAARRHASAAARITLAPVQLDALLSEATLMVTTGSTASVTQGLLNGVPQLISPRYIEQTLPAKRIEAIGAGAMLQARSGEEYFAEGLNAALENGSMRESAQRFKAQCRNFNNATPVMRKIAALEGALSMGSLSKVLQ